VYWIAINEDHKNNISIGRNLLHRNLYLKNTGRNLRFPIFFNYGVHYDEPQLLHYYEITTFETEIIFSKDLPPNHYNILRIYMDVYCMMYNYYIERGLRQCNSQCTRTQSNRIRTLHHGYLYTRRRQSNDRKLFIWTVLKYPCRRRTIIICIKKTAEHHSRVLTGLRKRVRSKKHIFWYSTTRVSCMRRSYTIR